MASDTQEELGMNITQQPLKNSPSDFRPAHKGYVGKTSEKELCPCCNGTGEVQRMREGNYTCPICLGRGYFISYIPVGSA